MTAHVTSIASGQPRSITSFTGQVLSIEVQPKNAAPSLIARLSDGTGIVDVVFMGRRDIPGVAPGARMTVTGRLGDSHQMYNPCFELD